jgi:multiple sugar transport system substrate-binding protein
MNTFRGSRSLCRPLSRRQLMQVSAGLALSGSLGTRATPSRAQEPGGSITVGFDASNTALAAIVEDAAAAVRQAWPGAEIEILPAPAGNFQTQLFLSLASGRAPDVFLTTGLGIGELGAGGYLTPLDDYLADWDEWEQYPGSIRDAIAYNGQVFALPAIIDAHFLYYRKDIFEQAGLDREWTPSTPDDVLAAARAVRDNVPDVMPYGLYAGANGGNATAARGFVPLAFAYGGTLTDEEGRLIIDSCAIREALAYYGRVFQDDGVAPPELVTAPNPSKMLRDAFIAGELAMFYDGSWVYGNSEASDPEVAANEVGYIDFPLASGDGAINVGGLGNCWYMNARAESKDLAWALISAGNTKEAAVSLNSTDPHLPPRLDALEDPAFQETPFLSRMVESFDNLLLAPPDPAYRQLVTVIQNATGIVATGEATPEEAVTRYAEEMTRILGEDRVVAQPCE